MKLDNKTYDVLKWIAQIGLPALTTLYVAIGGIWGLAYVKEVAGTLSAIDLFLGTLLGISSTNYYKEK